MGLENQGKNTSVTQERVYLFFGSYEQHEGVGEIANGLKV